VTTFEGGALHFFCPLAPKTLVTPLSLAGKNSSATVVQHLDGNRLRATLAPNVGLEVLPIPSTFPERRSNERLEGLSIPVIFSENRLPSMEREILSIPASFPERRPNARLEVLSEYRFPSERLESQPRRTSFSEYRFPSDGLECQSVWSSFPQNRSNVIGIDLGLFDSKIQQ